MIRRTHRSFFFNNTATTEIYTLALQTLFRSHTEQQLKNVMSVVNWLEHVVGKPYTPTINAPLATLIQATRIPGMWLRSLSAK